MKTNLASSFVMRPSTCLLLASLALLAAATRTPAQNDWGSALSFDGVDDYGVLPGGVWFGDQFTIEAWVYERRYGANVRIIDFGNAGNTNSVLVYLDSSTGRPAFQITGKGSVIAPQPIAINQWVHLAATFQTNGGGIIYVNGFAAMTNAAMTAPDPVIRTNAFVGRSNLPGDPYADAMFDDLRIWSVARSADEIREGMCRPLTGTESNVVAYYRFDEGAGTNVFDSTPHHLDGTLINEPAWANSTIPPFININAGLPGVYLNSVAWGDYDRDGRLDILLTGYDAGFNPIAQVWHNTGNGFTNLNAGLPGVDWSSVAWGDYDNDGRLDILLTGYANSGWIAQVWHNTGSGFTNLNAGLPGVSSGSVAWGDYDNDGRLDILLTGYPGGSYISQVWRNTGSGFTNFNAGLPGVSPGSVAWGDYDNDGGLDILMAGSTGSGRVAQVWRNTGSGFINLDAGLPGVQDSSVAWGDYDNDGQLDILLTGSSDSGRIAQVWRNTGSGFSNINAGLPGVGLSSVAWGDYDNDGQLDVLLTGLTDSGLTAQVWRNTGGGFTNINAGLPGVFYGSVAWGDYDNDGRLDILLTGWDVNIHPIAQVWRNIHGAANTPPAPPTGLAVAAAASTVTFSWDMASDTETPASGLTYNLRVGTTPGGSDIVSPQASAAGFRRLPALGNTQQRLSFPLASASMGPFYWSVQAVDSAFAGSPFAAENSFSLWLVPGPVSGPVPGDANGDGVVDAADLQILLDRLNGNGTVNSSDLAAVLAHLNGNGVVTQGDLDLVLAQYWPYSPWLYLTNVAGLGETNVTFALTNSTAGAFSVEMSTNLADWDYLGPATPRYEFTDTNAPAQPQRYYRLSWP